MKDIWYNILLMIGIFAFLFILILIGITINHASIKEECNMLTEMGYITKAGDNECWVLSDNNKFVPYSTLDIEKIKIKYKQT